MIALVSYMGVTERVREIGILRAVGFSAQNIKHIFLTEGATVGFFAGMIGVGVSTVMGELINKLVGLLFSEISSVFLLVFYVPMLRHVKHQEWSR